MSWFLPHAAKTGPRTLLTLGFLLLLLTGCLQLEKLAGVRYRWCSAESGLVLRAGPGREYARVGVIPFGTRVRVLGIVGEETVVAGQAGRWNRVDYQGLDGYSYDAFLAEAPPARLSPASRQPAASAGAAAPPVPRAPKRQAEKSERPREPAAPALPTAAAVAYAVHNSPSLTRLSSDEFKKIAGSLAADFRGRKAAFHESAGERRPNEAAEDYLARSERAKRRFLERLRREEQAAAARIYSIYDARLELGPYDPALGRFAWLGTTVPIAAADELTTLPDARAGRHRFVNGRKYDVGMTPAQAEAIRDARDEIRVRIDFSYTESLQDLFTWTQKAYFLPRYLMLYHRQTGRIYYACRVLPQVEPNSDPAAPLRISARLLGETAY